MGSLQDFRNFSVAIQDIKSREIAGTGFIVFTDGERVKIITAAHVVTDLYMPASAKPRHPRELIGKHVGIHFFQPLEPLNAQRDRTARVVACFSEFDDDVLLLELDGGDPRPPMARHQAILGAADSSGGHPYVTFGFAEIGREYPGGISDGLILGLAPSQVQGIYHSEMIQLQANNLGVRIQKGMSGGAVLDRHRNLVVGIVTEFFEPSTSGVAWAADCEVLSFTPIGLELIANDSQSESIILAREAYDRTTYEYVRKPGLKLFHTPKALENWVERHSLINLLDQYYWKTPSCKLIELIGFGGGGKSSLAQKWLERILSGVSYGSSGKKPRGIFWWDFYYDKNLDGCIAQLLAFVTGSEEILTTIRTPARRVERIKKALKEKGYLLVFDGFETMQSQHQNQYGEIVNKDLDNLLEFLADQDHKSFCLVTSRVPLFGLVNTQYLRSIDVEDLTIEEGVDLLRKIGVKGKDDDLKRLVVKWAGHALTLTILGAYLVDHSKGELTGLKDLPSPISDEPTYERLQRLLFRYDQLLSIEERFFLRIFSAFRSPVDRFALNTVFRNRTSPLTKIFSKIRKGDFYRLLEALLRKGLIRRSETLHNYQHTPPLPKTGAKRAKKSEKSAEKEAFIIHPLIRSYFYGSFSTKEKKLVNILLKKYVHKMQVPKSPKDVSQMRPLFDELYYMCEAGMYDAGCKFYRAEIAKEDDLPEDAPGYLTTVLLAYQADADLLAMFFEDGDWTKELMISKPEARAAVMINAGVALDYLGDLVNAVKLYERCARTAIEAKEWEYSLWSYENIATVYLSNGRLSEALGAATLALDYAKRIRARDRESIGAYMLIAWIKLIMGDIPGALDKIKSAYQILDENRAAVQDIELVAERAWHSEILAWIGSLNEAMVIAKQNQKNLKQLAWLDDVGQDRILGIIHLQQGNYKSALQYFDKAVSTILDKGMKEEITLSFLWRGKCLLDMKHYNRAREDFEYALQIAQTYHYVWELDVRNSLIQLRLLTSRSKATYVKSRNELLSIKSVATVAGYKWAEGDALFLLGELEKLDGKQKVARKYYKQCWEIRRAISDPKISQIREEYLR